MKCFIVLSYLCLAEALVDRSFYGFGSTRLRNHEPRFNDAPRKFTDLKSSSTDKSIVDFQDPDECGNVTTNFFPRAVKDNFAVPSQQELWDGKGQRYFINDQFWEEPGGPVFVYIVGEAPVSCEYLKPDTSLMAQLAARHRALMVAVELRFYGESFPTANVSNNDLAMYLSTSQTLADVERLIDAVLKEQKANNSKVVAFGGSYAGNVVTWLREKYPHIFHAAVASSAPVTAQTNFPQYMEVVTEALDTVTNTKACNDWLWKAVQEVVKLARRGSDGSKQLKSDFNICQNPTSEQDLAVLMSDLMGNIQETVQYNRQSSTAPNITDICTNLTKGTALEAYDNFAKISRQFTLDLGASCEDASYKNTIAYLSNTTQDPQNNMRPWVFQTCTEFGYFQVASAPSTPWQDMASYLSSDFYSQLCKDAFGGLANEPDVNGTNRNFGADLVGKEEVLTNVVFPNGNLDPWHVLGVTDGWRSILINGTSHCADMAPMLQTTQNSTPAEVSLRDAQQRISDLVGSWVDGWTE